MIWKKNQRYTSVYVVVMFGQLGARKSLGYALSAKARIGIGREGFRHPPTNKFVGLSPMHSVN